MEENSSFLCLKSELAHSIFRLPTNVINILNTYKLILSFGRQEINFLLDTINET